MCSFRAGGDQVAGQWQDIQTVLQRQWTGSTGSTADVLTPRCTAPTDICHQSGLSGLTRAQAEPRAALSLAARGESPILKLSPSDLVLYSAKARSSARLHRPRPMPCALPILVPSPGGTTLRSAKARPSLARARPCAAAARPSAPPGGLRAALRRAGSLWPTRLSGPRRHCFNACWEYLACSHPWSSVMARGIGLGLGALIHLKLARAGHPGQRDARDGDDERPERARARDRDGPRREPAHVRARVQARRQRPRSPHVACSLLCGHPPSTSAANMQLVLTHRWECLNGATVVLLVMTAQQGRWGHAGAACCYRAAGRV